jgi:hypothetical protein
LARGDYKPKSETGQDVGDDDTREHQTIGFGIQTTNYHTYCHQALCTVLGTLKKKGIMKQEDQTFTSGKSQSLTNHPSSPTSQVITVTDL